MAEVEDGEEEELEEVENGKDIEAAVLEEDGEEEVTENGREEELEEEENGKVEKAEKVEKVENVESWSDTDSKEVENGSGAGENTEESDALKEEEDGE